MSPLLKFLFRCKREPEARHRDVGFVTVLFEEHPLQHLGPAPTVSRQQECILAQVPKDRVRLREHTSIPEFEQRNAAIWILREKIGLARRSVMKPVLLKRKFHAELARGEPDFVAIAGHLHLMEHGHVKNPRKVMESMATGRALRRVFGRPVGGSAARGSQTIQESSSDHSLARSSLTRQRRKIEAHRHRGAACRRLQRRPDCDRGMGRSWYLTRSPSQCSSPVCWCCTGCRSAGLPRRLIC